MKVDYVHKDSTTLVQDELVKNELNQIELQYNALKQQQFNELLKENQELKSKLELYENGVYFSSEADRKDRQIDKLKKKYENAVADYEKTMFEKEQLNSLVNSCQEEIRQLKKQLEENKDKINWYENFEVNKTIDKLRLKHNNQQKEFIKYLEDKIKKIENNHEHMVVDMFGSYDLNELDLNILKEILQKYKSIIGDINDKK